MSETNAIDMVFPRPREVALDGRGGSPVELAAWRDETLPAQGYELEVGPTGTRIRHADDLGLRYARQTLAQLDVGDGTVPSGQIVDWPDFPHRGFMLDISRDRVPTMATFEWLIGRLAELRYNHLQLYIEHTFAYRGHDVVWRAATPITPAELRQLDELCRSQGIELAANQNTFGHMDRWLHHPEYRDRAECPDGSEHPVWKRHLPPWSLEPTPDNATFALDLVREQAANLQSPRVNIGADEPFDLGRGRSKARVEEQGRAAVFVEHLRRLTDPLISEGYEVMFWGDGLTRHPDLVPQLPGEGARAIVWHYEAPDPEGRSLAAVVGPELAELFSLPEQANLGFRAYARSYVDAGYPIWVAPGTSSWNALVGRWTNARDNLLDAAVVGLDVGADGYLVTDWGDNGHPQPLPVSVPAAAYGAGVAWCQSSNNAVDVAPVADRLLEADDGMGSRLLRLGDLYRGLGVSATNGSPLMYALLDDNHWGLRGELDATATETVETVVAETLDQLATVPFRGPRAEAVAAELVATCRLLRNGLWRLRLLRGDGYPDPEAVERDFAEVADLYRTAWLTTSRPSGLEDSIAKLQPGVP